MSTLFHGEEEAFNDDLKTLATCVQAVALRRPANRARSCFDLKFGATTPDSTGSGRCIPRVKSGSIVPRKRVELAESVSREAGARRGSCPVGGWGVCRDATSASAFAVLGLPARLCASGSLGSQIDIRILSITSAERMSGSSPGLKPRPLPLQNDPARRYDPGGSCPHGASADTARPGGNPETRETVSRTGGGSRFPTRDTRSRVTIRCVFVDEPARRRLTTAVFEVLAGANEEGCRGLRAPCIERISLSRQRSRQKQGNDLPEPALSHTRLSVRAEKGPSMPARRAILVFRG